MISGYVNQRLSKVTSQHGHEDVQLEMLTIDSIGPLARALFNDALRELSAKNIIRDYKRGRKIDLINAEADIEFANWLSDKYQQNAGHDISDGVRRRK